MSARGRALRGSETVALVPRERSGSSHQAVAVAALSAGLVGVGDGIVGMVPLSDRYASVHTVYRLSAITLGLVGLVSDHAVPASAGAVVAGTALLASRVPAVVSGGGVQQFG